MNLRRTTILSVLVVSILGSALGQQVTKHLMTSEELNKAVPTEYFYRGQKAPVQVRNSGGFQLADGKMTLASLVDASGYSTAIQQKYQGLFITESKLTVGGAELAPGQYGFGFTSDGKFVVMNVANEDVLNVPSVAFPTMQHAVPLKMEVDGSGYKLFAGKKWVAIKVQ